jgi:hypothetical protein
MVEAMIFPIWLKIIILIAVVWEVAWKGFGLWRAGKNNRPVWFVFILILNTLGILPIVYLTWFDKKRK